MTGSANRLRKWSLMISALLVFCLTLVSVAPAVLAADTIEIATEAYIYGYPLVTMDMTRKFLTNVAAPEAARAPMGQLIKLRTYPAVDDHAVTAPNADALYTPFFLTSPRNGACSAFRI